MQMDANHPDAWSVDQFDNYFELVLLPGEEVSWERGQVLDAIEAGRITEEQVWTVLDGEECGCMFVVPGFHLVNRVHDVVTTAPWTDDKIVAVWHESHTEEEDRDGVAISCDWAGVE